MLESGVGRPGGRYTAWMEGHLAFGRSVKTSGLEVRQVREGR